MTKPRAATGLGAPRCPRCATPRPEGEDCPRCGAPPGWAAPEPAARPDPLRGLAAPIMGARFVAKHPSLFTWIAIPLVVNLCLFGVIVWWVGSSLSGWVPTFEEPWWPWIDWLREGLGGSLRVLVAVVGVLAAFLTMLLLAGIVNAPFYDLLSDRVESRVFGRDDPGRGWLALPADTLRSLVAAASLAARQVFVLLLLFALSFVLVGVPLFAIAGFYYTGLGLLDVTLGRKLYPGRVRAGWGRKNALFVMGTGVFVSFVPPLAPFGVVGATLLFLEHPDKP